MRYKGHDERTESICVDCVHFGDCIYATEGKTICNKFKEMVDL